MLGKIRECNASLKEYILDFDKRIKDVLSSYHDAIERMCEIPGIQNRVCEDFVAEIGLDMSNFQHPHICVLGQECVQRTTRVQVRRKAAGQITVTSK